MLGFVQTPELLQNSRAQTAANVGFQLTPRKTVRVFIPANKRETLPENWDPVGDDGGRSGYQKSPRASESESSLEALALKSGHTSTLDGKEKNKVVQLNLRCL